MDDNKTNQNKNQSPSFDEEPKPLFETVPMDDGSNYVPGDNIQPEEVPGDVNSPDQSFGQGPSSYMGDQLPPVYEESKTKYFIIGGGIFFFFIIFFVLLMAILNGGNKKKATVVKNVSLTYWSLWEDKEVYQPLIDEYQSKNPGVKIVYQKMSQTDYRDKLIARSKDGRGPDIFRFHNTWLPEIKDVVAPIPPTIMTGAEFEKTFYPVQSKDLKIDKYYYGIPLSIDCLVLVYNEDMLKQAGISKPPVTWEEVIDMAGKITVREQGGNVVTSGIALGTASNVEHFSDTLGLILAQNGAKITDLNSAYAAQALEFYRKFAEGKDAIWTDAMPNSVNAFIQQKTAMIIAPSWEVATIKMSNPDLHVKTAVVPVLDTARPPITMASYWVEGVSITSKNQLEAWQFLKFLSEKQSMTKIFESQSKLRPFGSAYSRVDLGDSLAKHEILGAVIQQSKNMKSWPVVTRTFDKGLDDRTVKYLENAVNSSIQGVSYKESMSTANQGISQVFKEFGIVNID
jgi:multiple sugar transport system substrate-binding protein